MITSIKEDIEIMKIDVAFIKNSLKKKVDVEEFEALERRVAILEAKSQRK
jgi:polyhydroxyalkanoate synthesis regulator phasin